MFPLYGNITIYTYILQPPIRIILVFYHVVSKISRIHKSDFEKQIQFLVNIEEGLQEGILTTQAPEELTVISWNIDGLDVKNIRKRTKGVCK